MTTVAPPTSTTPATTPATPTTTGRWSSGSGVAALRDALARPLTSYYALLGASALLLTIGLLMVLSASSVYSFDRTGSSYTVVSRQLTWVVIGVPARGWPRGCRSRRCAGSRGRACWSPSCCSR